jgi:hypothetical protein
MSNTIPCRIEELPFVASALRHTDYGSREKDLPHQRPVETAGLYLYTNH